MKRTTLLLVLLSLSALLWSQTPKHEVRAVWLTTIGGIDWPRTQVGHGGSAERQRAELRQILDRLKAANINTVLLQSRVRSTTIYPSQYEPFDICLTGRAGGDPGYDPLAFAIEECHKRGMELHAWVVTIPVGKWTAPSVKRLRDRYPSLIKKIGDEAFMDPESETTGDYIAKMCREIVERYDVDGIHLDYIRYPENWKMRVSKQQGRNNITRIVRKIHRVVKQSKPWVKLSCSPIGKFDDLTRYSSRGWNAYTTVCQDAQGWLREGLMDELFPMMYFKGDNFYPFAIDWSEHTSGRIVAPGLGIWFLARNEGNWPLSDITRELQVLRQLNMGHTYFRSKFFTDNTKGIYNYTKDQFDAYPSLVPPMTWEHATPPTAPTDLQMGESNGMMQISWWGAQNRNDSPYLLYNVYASRNCPVDVNDSRNLIATRVRDNHITIRGNNEGLYYAVTAMDRYGNESRALQSDVRGSQGSSGEHWLQNDGRRLQLPHIDPSMDVQVWAVKSMAGNVITSVYRTDAQYLDIRRLPEGVYTLYALNKSRVGHRMGRFIVKR